MSENNMQLVEEVEAEVVEQEEVSENSNEQGAIEEEHQKRVQELKDRAGELAEKIKELNQTLAEKSYIFTFESAVESDFDFSVYDDRKKYYEDLLNYIKKDVKWSQWGFLQCIQTGDFFQEVVDNFEEGADLEIPYNTLEMVNTLIYSAEGVGYDDAKYREYLLRPINNTYALYIADKQEIEGLTQEYQQIMQYLGGSGL